MDDLIVEFITETGESLAMLDTELVKLEHNPQDEGILGNIFRIMHTIKGTCGFLGLPRLEHVAHASENVLGKIRDKKMEATPQAVTLILESLDNIKELLDYLSANGQEQDGDDSELIGRLNQFADSGGVSASASAGASAGVSEEMVETPAPEAAPAENQFSHFKGDDDPFMVEALAKMAAEEAAKKAAEQAPAAAAIEAAPEPASQPAPQPAAKAKEPAAKSEDKKTEDSANQSIRVNIDVLENLMQMVSELVLTRNQLMQIVRSKDDKELLTPLQQLSHITSELQEGVMKTRMQPIGNAWAKFPRLIRDLSLELGKKIELKMNGAETELDRQLLEVIKDPLTHMVRNSCDHGLEKPADRLAAGKPEVGTVTLSAYHEGGHIIIEIVDDGRGINIERVKQKALANGLATEASLEAMSEKQIAQFIFAAGFSTAEAVTSVSGRGVGMDVVKTNIQKIGGALDLDSTWGKGSKVAVKIPLTLAIVSVLIVETHGQKFAIPQINVVELVRAAPEADVKVETINNALVMRLRDKLLPLAVMSELLGFDCDHAELMKKEIFVVVCRVGNYDFGILVDRVFDTEEIVVKPVSDILKSISLYSGNTILGDGSVIMILDPNGIARTISSADVSSRAENMNAVMVEEEKSVSFLCFSLGSNASPKAVPLELVSRLEEIDVKDIEVAGDKPVVQYRGDLMRLITLDNELSLPNSGMVDVIVFGYDKKVIGLVVSEIIDIIKAPFDIKLTTKEAKEHGYLGSMVLAGKTTDVVDIGYLLKDLVDDAVANVSASGKNHGANKTILLVEDSPFFRNLTVPMLSAVGYKVTTAENGEIAFNMLTNDNLKFDAIVTDIEMPVMDGFQFASACRKTPKINGTPIIAYTASLSNEVIERSKSVGMNDCITKTDRLGLLDSVAHWLVSHKEAI